MTGAVMALAGSEGSAGGGGGVIPSPTPAWSAIYDTDIGSTNLQTISGIGGPISVSVTPSGGGLPYYTLGSGLTPCTGAFTVRPGDALGLTVFAVLGGGTVTGTLTVRNLSDGGTTLAVIAYAVFDSGGV